MVITTNICSLILLDVGLLEVFPEDLARSRLGDGVHKHNAAGQAPVLGHLRVHELVDLKGSKISKL